MHTFDDGGSGSLVQPLPERYRQTDASEIHQRGDFPKCDVGDENGALRRAFAENPALRFGQLAFLLKPPQQHMSVEEGLHRRRGRSASQSRESSVGETISPMVSTVPR